MGYGQVGRVSRFETLVGAEGADKRVEIAAAENVVFLKFFVKGIAAHAILLFVDKYREIGIVVTHAIYVLEHANAGNVFEGFPVFLSSCLAARDGAVHLFQVQEPECGADFVHFAVDARSDNGRFVGKAKVFQIVNSLLGGFVVANQCAAFYRGVNLGGVETEGAHVARFQYGFTVHTHAECVCGIVNHLESVNVCNFLDSLGVAGRAVNMHGHDCRGVGRNGGLDFFGVNVACFFFYIYEYGLKAVPPDRVCCRHKTVRGGDDFARDAHGLQCGNQRQGAVGEQAKVFDAEVFRQGLFKFLVVVPVVGEPLAVPNILEHRDKVVKIWQQGRGDGNRLVSHKVPSYVGQYS